MAVHYNLTQRSASLHTIYFRLRHTLMNYKDTLNLPRTDFPMKANLAQREPEILKAWEHKDLYAKIQAASRRAGKVCAP